MHAFADVLQRFFIATTTIARNLWLPLFATAIAAVVAAIVAALFTDNDDVLQCYIVTALPQLFRKRFLFHIVLKWMQCKFRTQIN